MTYDCSRPARRPGVWMFVAIPVAFSFLDGGFPAPAAPTIPRCPSNAPGNQPAPSTRDAWPGGCERDGLLDLVTGNVDSRSLELFLNRGGALEPEASWWPSGSNTSPGCGSAIWTGTATWTSWLRSGPGPLGPSQRGRPFRARPDRDSRFALERPLPGRRGRGRRPRRRGLHHPRSCPVRERGGDPRPGLGGPGHRALRRHGSG